MVVHAHVVLGHHSHVALAVYAVISVQDLSLPHILGLNTRQKHARAPKTPPQQTLDPWSESLANRLGRHANYVCVY